MTEQTAPIANEAATAGVPLYRAASIAANAAMAGLIDQHGLRAATTAILAAAGAANHKEGTEEAYRHSILNALHFSENLSGIEPMFEDHKEQIDG